MFKNIYSGVFFCMVVIASLSQQVAKGQATSSYGRTASPATGKTMKVAGSERYQWALKTNLLYGGYTFTPNLGLELGLGYRSTLDVGFGYNPWNYDGVRSDNKKLVHMLGQIEYRYWFCAQFSGAYIGAQVLGSSYSIGGHELPLLFGKGSKDYLYEGFAVGAGVSVGYQFMLSKHWNIELGAGFGYARMFYDKYDCIKCGRKEATEARNYWGPTKASVSLVFVF